MRIAILSLLLVLGVTLASCSAVPPTPFDSPVTTDVAPTLTDKVAPNPAESPISPTPPVSAAPLAPNFRLNPVTADSTAVTGQAPVGFTVVIVDATSGAKMLGKGESDADGSFRIALDQPLRKGHVIGLTVDLTREQLASEELMLKLFDARGAGFRFIPQFVTIYDGYEVP
jgi:hypothetical protein